MELTTRFINIDTFELANVECPDGERRTFYIDVVLDKNESTFNAWFYADNFCHKMFMFGVPLKQENGSNDGKTFNEILQEFVAVWVSQSIDEFVELYYEEIIAC